MKKVLEISTCLECKHLASNVHFCNRLHQKIEHLSTYSDGILGNCPLPDAKHTKEPPADYEKLLKRIEKDITSLAEKYGNECIHWANGARYVINIIRSYFPAEPPKETPADTDNKTPWCSNCKNKIDCRFNYGTVCKYYIHQPLEVGRWTRDI